MSRTSFTRARLLARLAAPVLMASALAACSSMPDWVDPTGWFGGDSQATSDQSSGAAEDAAQTPNSGQTPDLASIPPRPTPPSTPDEQKQVANSLVADRAQAQYSADALQGGTEPVAPPPPPQSPSNPAVDQSGSAPAAPAPASATDNAPTPEPPTSAADNTAPPAAAGETTAQTATANSSATQVASTESRATTVPAAAPMAAASNSSPAAGTPGGFAPSRAPALDPSVAQYVPQRILSRYQQTATAASVPGVEGMPASAAARPVHRRKPKAAATEPAPDSTAAPAP